MPSLADTSWLLHFPPPDKIWSTNDERKMHHMKRAGLVAAWRDAAFWSYKHQWPSTQMPTPALVELHIPVKDKRRRDPMNFCGTIMKAVIDGMVLAGAWPDDTPEYVRHLEPLLTPDKKQVYVFVTEHLPRD